MFLITFLLFVRKRPSNQFFFNPGIPRVLFTHLFCFSSKLAKSHFLWYNLDFKLDIRVKGCSLLNHNPNIYPYYQKNGKKWFLNEVNRWILYKMLYSKLWKYADKYMFLQAVQHINRVKTGPFSEHSNTLWGVSGCPNWEKVMRSNILVANTLCQFVRPFFNRHFYKIDVLPAYRQTHFKMVICFVSWLL